MRRRRHRPRLDLLPLLDVFMVVLFVFATIQEKELSESVSESKRLDRDNVELTRRVRELEERTSMDLEETVVRLETAQRRLEERTAELQEARRDVERLHEQLDELHEQLDSELARSGRPGREAVRRDDVLTKLLDHFSVFEIEIAGGRGSDQVNRCCYRANLDDAVWRSCGELPSREEEIEAWIETGANGLVDALRKTKGGNAMVVVRQDAHAAYQVSGKLEASLRSRFAQHEIYDDGLASHALDCATPTMR